MPEPIPASEPRLGANDKARIAELERVVKALLHGIQEAESVEGEAYMPEGTYFGVSFEG